MKVLLFVFIFFYSCTSSPKSTPPCYPDQGIKEAVTIATSYVNKEDTIIQIINYDQYGKPISRKQDKKREILYNYSKGKLINTIISNYAELENNLERKGLTQSIDTNHVIKNDQYGRVTEMRGSDGSKVEFSYDGCEKETQKYFDQSGNEIHEYVQNYKDGILTKTDWLTPNNEEGQETLYYSYKFDSKGKWIEREYEHSSSERIIEKRTLKYY